MRFQRTSVMLIISIVVMYGLIQELISRGKTLGHTSQQQNSMKCRTSMDYAANKKSKSTQININMLSSISTTATHTSDPSERNSRLQVRLRRMCENLQLENQEPHFALVLRSILVDEERKVLYCSVPKIASTSWKRAWLRLTTNISSEEVSRMNRDAVHRNITSKRLSSPKYYYSYWAILKTYRKFLFIRNPFQRVVSAFRDKVEQFTGDEKGSFLGFLKSKLRNASNSVSTSTDKVAFPQFVRFILEEPADPSVIPNFDHWMPIHKVCNPCHIKYDFIGKFENMDEDAAYIWRWLGLSEDGDKERGGFHLPSPTLREGTGSKDVASSYFRQLTPELRLAFLRKYVLDYNSFDYEFI